MRKSARVSLKANVLSLKITTGGAVACATTLVTQAIGITLTSPVRKNLLFLIIRTFLLCCAGTLIRAEQSTFNDDMLPRGACE